MEFMIDIMVLVALLVWSVVGIITIGYYVYYHKLLKPIMGPMMNMYKKMFEDMNEEEL